MNLKRFAPILTAFAMICVTRVPHAVSADDYFTQSGEKLGRGFTNVAVSPLEVLRAMERNVERDRPFRLLFFSPIEGLFRTTGRMVIGTLEVATFWFPHDPIITPADGAPGIQEYINESRDPDKDGPHGTAREL